MTTRLAYILLTALALPACDGANGDTQLDTAAKAIAAPRTDTTQSIKPVDSVTSTTLLPAAADYASDTIPLRAPDGRPARYGLKSGYILQRYSGHAQGERRVWFDDYGLSERKEEHTIPHKRVKSVGYSNLIIIATSDSMSVAEVRTKKGSRRPNGSVERYLASPESKSLSLGDVAIRASGADLLPDTTIAGYRCKVLRKTFDGVTRTVWVWRGIPLRELVEVPADNVRYMLDPVEIKPDIAIDDSTFRFPADFTITEFQQ